MRRAMPGCIAAISSTVSVPCLVVARTRAPGSGPSSMAEGMATGSRTFRVSLSLLDACPTRASTMDVSLSQNGTRLSPDWVGRSGMTLMELERGTYDLHLVGSGKVAVGWNFVFSGVQQFPANQRLVAALAPRADNRLTISLLSASVPSVHVFV